MDINDMIKPGMTHEETFLVEEQHLAPHVGSGAVRVLATPWMIAFMEITAHRLLAKHLPEGQSSVGTHVDVRHLAATPLGDSVRYRAEVLAVQGIRVQFAVSAWDSQELIGEGKHERAVIDVARFLKRVSAKANAK